MVRPGETAWTEHTTPFDRVRAVILAVPKPRSVEYIAEEAAVSVETARNHLESLVELAVALEHDGGDQPVYVPDLVYTRFQTLRSLLDAHDRDGLIEIRDELQTQIDTWQDEYGVDSPDMLRDHATTSESPQDTGKLHETADELELVEHRLSIVTDVIARYDTHTTMD